MNKGRRKTFLRSALVASFAAQIIFLHAIAFLNGSISGREVISRARLTHCFPPESCRQLCIDHGAKFFLSNKIRKKRHGWTILPSFIH